MPRGSGRPQAHTWIKFEPSQCDLKGLRDILPLNILLYTGQQRPLHVPAWPWLAVVQVILDRRASDCWSCRWAYLMLQPAVHAILQSYWVLFLAVAGSGLYTWMQT